MPKSANPLHGRRSISSPLSASKRKGPSQIEGEPVERLDDTGAIPSIAPPNVAQDVTSLVRHALSHTWAEMPDRASGMGSERISEVLRFRNALPAIVSLAHLHALSVSGTETERELARLVAMGRIRKLAIPGRGKGGAAVGEGVVLVTDWKRALTESNSLDEAVKDKYVSLMDKTPASATTPIVPFSDAEVRQLVSEGFFTSPAALVTAGLSNLFAAPGASSLGSISLSGSQAATGTYAAVGGYGAIHDSGGGGSTLATRDRRAVPAATKSRQMTFSLPGTGAYLKLLLAARQHLLTLLKQLSPRFKEATLELLKEKWDGNIPNDAASRAKRARGEWTGVLPGKTKKWKDFYGLEFEWVLAECIGAGLVECFDTGSVGWGVRAV